VLTARHAPASYEAFCQPSIWQTYEGLPNNVRELADKDFTLLKLNAQHPSLNLKRVGRYWSVRVGKHYRALALDVDGGLLWFWIGTHADYDGLIK
jgi:hypothetical protein